MNRMIDCAVTTEHQIEAIKSTGIFAIARYLQTGRRPTTKTLRSSEVKAASKAGVRILSIYESSSDNPGYFADPESRGKADATKAVESAEALEQPVGSVIAFTVDFDCTQPYLGNVMDYFSAIREVIEGKYLLTSYGNGLICSHLKTAGLVHFTWVSMSSQHTGTPEYIATNQWDIHQLHGGEVARIAVDWNVINDHAREAGTWTLQL